MSEPLLVQLVRTLARPISESDRARARLHLLDWLACVAGARQTQVAKVLYQADLGGARRAGWLGGVLEMDDVHRAALLHPGPVIWAAALRSRANSPWAWKKAGLVSRRLMAGSMG